MLKSDKTEMSGEFSFFFCSGVMFVTRSMNFYQWDKINV